MDELEPRWQERAAVGTWTAQDSGSGANRSDVAFTDARHGWAVSDGGTILATTSASSPSLSARRLVSECCVVGHTTNRRR